MTATIETAAEPEKKPPAKKKPTKPKAPEKTSGVFCYAGPSISGVITEGTIYAGSRSQVMKQLDKEIKLYPAIKGMLIPGDRLTAVRKSIKSPVANQYSITYRELQKAVPATKEGGND